MDRLHIPLSDSSCRLGLLGLFAMVAPGFAQGASGPELPENPYLSALWVVVGLIGIWLVFYKLLYPFLLRSYKAETCQRFFWILYFLYAVTWLHLSTYVFFEYGFYWLWIRWVAAFLGGLFLIALVLAYLRRSHT